MHSTHSHCALFDPHPSHLALSLGAVTAHKMVGVVCFGSRGGIWVLSKLVVAASETMTRGWRRGEEEALTVGVGRVSALSEGEEIEEGGKEGEEEVRFWCLTGFRSWGRGRSGGVDEGFPAVDKKLLRGGEGWC